MRLKFKKSAAAISVLVLLAGCAGVGNERLRKETESTVATKIVEGKTTQSQIRAQFGSPSRTTFTDAGLEIWTYSFSNVSADAVSYIPFINLLGSTSSGTEKELVILFNKSDVVKRYSMSESEVSSKTGLFNN